jgi:hypothetical protein
MNMDGQDVQDSFLEVKKGQELSAKLRPIPFSTSRDPSLESEPGLILLPTILLPHRLR